MSLQHSPSYFPFDICCELTNRVPLIHHAGRVAGVVIILMCPLELLFAGASILVGYLLDYLTTDIVATSISVSLSAVVASYAALYYNHVCMFYATAYSAVSCLLLALLPGWIQNKSDRQAVRIDEYISMTLQFASAAMGIQTLLTTFLVFYLYHFRDSSNSADGAEDAHLERSTTGGSPSNRNKRAKRPISSPNRSHSPRSPARSP